LRKPLLTTTTPRPSALRIQGDGMDYPKQRLQQFAINGSHRVRIA
jgi:hypothetical protein